MGIGSIYKQLTFGGEMSGDYGLYITGAGTFNAPIRDVEMVTIPGRNGSFALDHGRFENIEVTYPAGVYGSDVEDFADRVAEIRAWLCSKKGYLRLTDEYNPNEYRLAVYKSGLDVSPALLKAGEFDLVFECMPQRFLTSGEIAEAVTSGADYINPTRFPSRPLLEVTGYGTIGINEDEVAIISEPLGDVVLAPLYGNTKRGGTSMEFTIEPRYASLHPGNKVRFPQGSNITVYFDLPVVGIYDFNQTGTAFSAAATAFNTLTIQINGFEFNYGETVTESATFTVGYGDITFMWLSVDLAIDTEGVISITVRETRGQTLPTVTVKIPSIHGISTKTALGEPLYFDLDIGEAYKIENGSVISVNSAVIIPPELPEMKPGANTITYDDTITDLKIFPRWWTV